MRTAEDIITDYRARGYTNKRLRALANGRSEPMRTQMLEILDSESENISEDVAAIDMQEEEVVLEENEKTEETFAIQEDSEIIEQVENIMDEVLDSSVELPDSQIIPEDSAITPELPGVEVVAEVEIEENDIVAEVEAEPEYTYTTDAKFDAHVESHAAELKEQAIEAINTFTSWEKHDAHVADYNTALAELELEIEAETVDLVDIPKIEIETTMELEETQIVEEINDEINLEEDSIEIDDLIKEALGYHPKTINLNMPKLTQIEAVFVEAKDFIDQQVESLASSIIDLRADEEAVAEHLGEAWPTAEEVSAAEHELEPYASTTNEQKFETEENKYREVIAAPSADIHNDIEFMTDDDKYREVVAIPNNLQRTLEVIEGAGLDIDMEGSLISEESNIIDFDPPYAVETPMMYDEESAIIKFPSSVEETYAAIRSILPNNGEVIIGNDKVDSNDLIIRIEQEMTPATEMSVEELIQMPSLFEHEETIEEEPAVELELKTEAASEDAQEEVVGENITEEIAEETTVPTMTFETDIREMEQIENEMAAMQRMLGELEEADTLRELEVTQMKSLLENRDETMGMQNKELTQVRHELIEGMQAISEAKEIERQYTDLQADYTTASKRIVETDRKLNIINTETLPNLEADKNDLIELIEEQSEETINLQSALSSSGRRAAFGFTTAAAACMLAVLMPVLHFMGGKDTAREFQTKETILTASIEKAQQTKKDLEKQNTDLNDKYNTILSSYDADKELWQNRLASVSSKYDGARAKLLQANAQIKKIQSGTTLAVSVGKPETKQPTNIVSNWESWNGNKPVAKKEKTGIVRRGDGLSHVLWRECGASNQAMVDWVVRKNKLPLSSRGYPIIQPKQKLILPSSNKMAFLTQ